MGRSRSWSDEERASRAEIWTPEMRAAQSDKVRGRKLTEKQVIEARGAHKYGSFSHGTAALARRYGVGYAVMYSALHGKTWAHVPGAIAQYVTGSQAFEPEEKIGKATLGLTPEGDVRLTANIREDLHLKLKIAAATRRTTIGDLIEELIESHLTETIDEYVSVENGKQGQLCIEDLKLAMDQALIDGDEERFEAAQTAYLDARASPASE